MQEACNLLEKKLPIPGYQHLLKLSHCFNVLDARGAVGVTQRAKCFATMRKLARQVTGQQHLTHRDLLFPHSQMAAYLLLFLLCITFDAS